MACYGGLSGIKIGLSKSTDHPSVYPGILYSPHDKIPQIGTPNLWNPPLGTGGYQP